MLPDSSATGRDGWTETVSGVLVERCLRHYRNERLPQRFYALRMARRQLGDAVRFLQILNEFRPDVVNWWNLEGLTKAILPIPRAHKIPDVCCLDDTWVIREYGVSGENDSLGWFRFWGDAWGPAFLRPLLRPLLAKWRKQTERQGIPTRPVPGVSRHACYVSEFMRFEHRRAGITFPSSEVIYGGVSPEQFYAPPKLRHQERELRLLYAGYVDENRGLHTIVEALGLLPPDLLAKVRLTVVPAGPPERTRYVEGVLKRIRELVLSDKVKFLQKQNHDQMPQIYQEHDLLILASSRPEGLPLTMMEALCAGCAVITTGSGGAIEIADAADLPIFPREHPIALSRLLGKLAANPERVLEIARHGQQVVLDRFTFERMMREFSQMLTALCEKRGIGQTSQEHSSADVDAHCFVRKSCQ
jgi:glycosyltransferase involved in cell wall biosynthesis